MRALAWLLGIAASWGLLLAIIAVTAHGADWLRDAMGLNGVELIGVLLGALGIACMVVMAVAVWLAHANRRRWGPR